MAVRVRLEGTVKERTSSGRSISVVVSYPGPNGTEVATVSENGSAHHVGERVLLRYQVTDGRVTDHAGDVRRVADAIAAGSAVLRPEWREDTAEGRAARRQWYEALRRETVRERWIQGAVVLGLLLCVAVVWFLGASAY